ncbi:MAG: GIY-YIG nuclease family protein [Pseudomarimonas sp.]
MTKSTSSPPPTSAHVEQPAARWFVYLLECSGGSLYCGITPDLQARFARHQSGKGAAYTRMHRPLRMLAALPCDSRATASRVETCTKRLSASAKRALATTWPLREGLPACAVELD